MMPDLFHWLLTGEKANEFTDATTTQIYNPVTKDWAAELLRAVGLAHATSWAGSCRRARGWGRCGPDVAEATGLRASRWSCRARTTRPAP